MALFDAAELADLQALWADSLAGTATVLRPSYTVATGGGRTVTWGTVTANVAARWQPIRYRGTEGPQAGAVWAVGPMAIMLPAGTDVQTRDRIRNEADASLWEVRGTSGGRTLDYGVQVDAEEVEA